MHTNRLIAALGGAALMLAVGACGDTSTGVASDAESTTSSPKVTTEASSLSIKDPWVKSATSGMTAAFGTLENSGPTDVTIVSATSSITSSMELHETVENSDGSMAMQPKKGGFTIAAGADHELAPGGDHLMIMDLNKALRPGEVVTITLTLEDGSTMDIEATVKSFSGADENYQNGDDSDMGDMDMGPSEDSSEGM
ncbi:copper chaperone PCu(A)C [Nocardioides sp.]|uniref:copper chaperone PCu(A)C n=1 Tax=Nocardioides sp. TaxID=35761 RepID=UPI003D11E44A